MRPSLLSRTSVWPSLLALTLACGGIDPPQRELSPSSDARPITGGAPTVGFPAVVALAGRSGGSFCTGTLIDPLHVLTAGHCVSRGAPQASPPAYILICPDAAAVNPTTRPDCYLRTRSAVVHPGFRLLDSPYLDVIHDIAVVTLAAPTTVPPHPLPLGPLPKSATGTPLRVVGYGRTETGGRNGLKRQAISTTTHVGPADAGTTGPNPEGLFAGMFQMTGVPGTCNGDSGGPAFWPLDAGVPEAVVGVTSTGDAACLEFGIDTDVGSYLCWLASVGVSGASCPDGGTPDGGPADAGDGGDEGVDGGTAPDAGHEADAGDPDGGEPIDGGMQTDAGGDGADRSRLSAPAEPPAPASPAVPEDTPSAGCAQAGGDLGLFALALSALLSLRRSPRRAGLFVAAAALLAGCSVVRMHRVRPDWKTIDAHRLKHLVVVTQPAPSGNFSVGELFSLVARRYINQKRNFIVAQHTVEEAAVTSRGLCSDGLEGVLWLRPQITTRPGGVEATIDAVLWRCFDHEEVWAAQAGGSFSTRDEGLKEVAKEYVTELSPDVEPYVPAAFHLLRPMLDTLPDPVLSAAEVDEKIELGE